MFVNATKKYQFKAKDNEIKKYPLCLGNISGDLSANTKWVCLYDFSVAYKTFGTADIIDIHKYLMEKHNIK